MSVPAHARRGEALPGRVAAALAAADIPASKLGAARRARLSASERELYSWILQGFASSGRPRRSQLDAAAARLGADPHSALATLAREDLVHVDAPGEIVVAYPFSGRPTSHQVRFPSGHEAYAMCAIDALGIAPMVGQPVEIASRDPLTGEEVRVRVAPDLEAEWSPVSAVVVTGAVRDGADSCSACCPVLNFFASGANAGRWLAEHPEISGEQISMVEAILAGDAVFGDVLRDT